MDPSAEELSLTQIRHKKHEKWGKLFEETDGDGTIKVKQGEHTSALPWLRSTVLRFRSNMCFRACVAREPETPLTELHLMQPVLGLLLLLALVMLLVTTAFAVCNGLGILTLPDAAERALAILCAALAATASAGLLYVGLIARGVPSHEELNVQLNRGNDRLGDAVGNARANAVDAERLKKMTLRNVRDLGSQRDKVRELNAQHDHDTHALWAFQFKVILLVGAPVPLLRY